MSTDPGPDPHRNGLVLAGIGLAYAVGAAVFVLTAGGATRMHAVLLVVCAAVLVAVLVQRRRNGR